MENFTQIKLFFWMGSAVMAFLSIGVVALALLYQNRMFKIKKHQSSLLLKAVLHKEQEERKRISEDLHDTVSGNLSSIHIYFSLLKKKITDPEVISILTEAAEELKNTQQEIRRISFNLMPPALITSGFIPSLEDLLRRNSMRNHFKYYLHSESEVFFAQKTAYQLLQIFQELITNSSQHGFSKNIRVTITSGKNGNYIEYHDDGKNYDFYKELKQTSGNGLKNILSRIESINSTLEQKTSSDGNILTIQIYHED